MGKKKIIGITFIIYSVYLIATIYQSDFFGNILSPILALLAFAILMKLFLSEKNNRLVKFVWLCYGIACLAWASGDIVWAIYEITPGLDPETSILIVYLYPITNIFLAIGIFLYAIQMFKRWNMIQLVIDAVAITLVSLMLFWIIFLDKNMIMVDIAMKDGLSSVVSIIIDVVIFVGTAIWYFSGRRGKIPFFIRVASTGVIIFVFTDLYYYYIYFKEVYVANTIIDAVYILALILIAVGCLLSKGHAKRSLYDGEEVEYSNVGFKRKIFMFFIAPVLAVFAEGFVIIDLLGFLVIIMLYETMSSYVQGSINNEMLLKKEKEMNYVLEKKVQQRTNEILEKNKKLEENNKKLDFLSNQDTVTNLYNRRYFINSLEEELKTIKSTETVAIVYIDVDRFKTINDTYGHQMGDKLLIALSHRLKAFNHENTILARLGGDEFVIGYHGEFGYEQIEKIAKTIIEKCGEVIEIDHYVFHVSISIGISIYPLDAKDSHTLMKNADIAMYEAKALGRERYIAFDHSFTDKINRKNNVEILLRATNFDKDFEVFYQPQFSIPDRKLIGAEALIRWNNSPVGFISPAEFIPVAEEIDYINAIGEWVMNKAIFEIGKWNNTYLSDLKVGINVSPKQLDNKDFIGILKKSMEDNSVLAEWVDIEITESIAIEGEYRIKQIDSLFEGLGVSISIDDFGTGYSSLSYLKFFPYERIKIAKPLIDAIATVNYDLQIVKAIIMLSKSIGMKTIAEGVETEEQLNILVALGCDEIQGYFLGRPIPSEAFEEMYLKVK